MRFYMFGMDGVRPEDCARDLKARGFSAVVSPPNARAAEAVHAQEMEVWGCIGAFSMREGDPQDWLAEDAFGERRRWFGSGCPNEPALWERGFLQIETWKNMGASCVMADGARFASPCPGNELFFSCFCPRCMAQGQKMGFDMETMRESVRLYANTPDLPPPAQWLRFREQCAKAWFSQFASRVQATGMTPGSFLFTPGLAPFVGQTPSAVETLAIAAPMLYRKYSHRPGIACLNDEYASLFRQYAARADADPARSIREQTGMHMPFDNADDIWQNGFEPEAIGLETARAGRMYRAKIAPILQLDDDMLDLSVRCAAGAGADAIGFFAYSREKMACLPDLQQYDTTRRTER